MPECEGLRNIARDREVKKILLCESENYFKPEAQQTPTLASKISNCILIQLYLLPA